MRTLVLRIRRRSDRASRRSADDKPVQLKKAPGVDKVEANCQACHSLSYIPMNSPFLNAAGWDAEVTRVICIHKPRKYLHGGNQPIADRYKDIRCPVGFRPPSTGMRCQNRAHCLSAPHIQSSPCESPLLVPWLQWLQAAGVCQLEE